MSPNTLDGLAKLVVRLRLAEPSQVEACVAELGMTHSDPADLLRKLEKRGLLTSLQKSMLARGDGDGIVLGRCKLLYRNASGSFARVYRAESIDNGQMVGLKLLRQRWAKDKEAVKQFHREAEVCKRLHHKNIVPIYEIGQQDDYHFFTMEFVEGGNLRDFITIRKKLSPAEAVRCILDMAEGLEYALRMGLTHRDLKLTNVLMGTDGVAKLVDFGLAGDGSGSGSHSGDGVPRALEYATLEKGTGAPNNDSRSDLFFLGTIFYELLTGVPPYPRTRSREERKQLSRYSHVRSIQDVDPNVGGLLAEVVAKLMKLNPNERYQSATDLIKDLKPLAVELGSDQTGPSRNGVARPEAVDEVEAAPESPSVMCIESRPKHQNVLREYFTKHGFRVLVLSDVKRAISRIRTNPPDCVVMMGESVGADVESTYDALLTATQFKPLVALTVLSRKQTHLKSELRQSESSVVVTQPVTLRELRTAVQRALKPTGDSSGELDAVPVDAG